MGGVGSAKEDQESRVLFWTGETVFECRGPQLKRNISKDETAEIFSKDEFNSHEFKERIERPW